MNIELKFPKAKTSAKWPKDIPFVLPQIEQSILIGGIEREIKGITHEYRWDNNSVITDLIINFDLY